MTALVPIWIIFILIPVFIAAAVFGAIAYGRFCENRALGLWDYIKPVHDWRLRPYGRVKHFFIETFHDGRSWFPQGNGKGVMIKNKGIFGWFGGDEEIIDPSELVEVDGMYILGKTPFMEQFNIKQMHLQQTVDHLKQEVAKWQALAQQRKHDPQVEIEQLIDNQKELAKAQPFSSPAGKKPGSRPR